MGNAAAGLGTVDWDWVGLPAFNQSNAIRVDNMSQMREAEGEEEEQAKAGGSSSVCMLQHATLL